MAGSLEPVLELLPRAPLQGLDVQQVQRERRDYWDRFMDKVSGELVVVRVLELHVTRVVQYEALGMEDEEEVAISDIDKPSRLAKVKVGGIDNYRWCH